MLDFSFYPPGAGWTSVGNAILVLISGVALVSFLDFIIFGVADIVEYCDPRCRRRSGDKYVLKLWRVFHAFFHSLHLLILFITLWASVSKIMSENAASKVFGGLAVGMGLAMQGMLKSVVCYFRILLGGEILEKCRISVLVAGKETSGTVVDISIFHVAIKDEQKMIYISNSTLIDAIFTVETCEDRYANAKPKALVATANPLLFRHRLVR